MASKCLLFVYGLLKPAQSPPRSLSQHWPDRVRGALYDLGDYPAGVSLGSGDTWIEGYTLEIDADELELLDEFEDVESGEFRRVVVSTDQGFVAWAYEYCRALPPELKPVGSWKP